MSQKERLAALVADDNALIRAQKDCYWKEKAWQEAKDDLSTAKSDVSQAEAACTHAYKEWEFAVGRGIPAEIAYYKQRYQEAGAVLNKARDTLKKAKRKLRDKEQSLHNCYAGYKPK
ncbi:chromosome segregation ATPase [Rubricella aquisinus]|uniref:Chromosome segregation ATPase n=1 Tax=Rubricella aquisinus TaxID=2028108 RepID=A0A840X235_9RHOB|nr:hypothetical protein [Rubricella aquisinus]MBB5515945.1 chromosome segregation ATPase [Rubricella aquisinus]